MKKLLPALFVFGLLLAIAPLSSRAQVSELDRFVAEKDWTPWKQAILQPDTVTKLFIRDRSPLNYEMLPAFTNLKGLIIYDSPLPDLAFLEHFPNLRILEVQGNSLRSLKGIENCRKLQEFATQSNFVADLSPMDSLLDLTRIVVYDNEITSLAPIGHLEKVTHLDVSKSKITTLFHISQWSQLTYLSVYKCYELTDIDAVKNFTQLTDLNISFLPIPDFSLVLLSEHKSLKDLRVQGMVKSNQDLQYIMHHTTITDLTMGKNDNVTTIDSLRFLVKLKYLDIHSNNVDDLYPVRNFPQLVKLVMYRNKVRDISPLLSCPDLRSLFLHENPIQDYSPLFQMGYLQHLNLNRDDFDQNSEKQLRQALRSTGISFY
jgi:internalin A